MSAQPLQTVVQDKCALLVQLLHEGVTKELLYKEFKKYGTIKSLKHFAKTKSAQIEFTTPEEASTAKRMLNHSQLLRKEINIVNYQNKDELKQKKKFNLFLHNVPQHLETSKLHNFMSKYGEITSLMLKKNDENLNLGYGYVQFETKEAYEKILSEHNEFGKITIVNTNDSFNVQMFNDSTKNKSNTIHIQGLFEKEVQPSESAEKAKEISAIFEKTKNQLNLSQFSYHTQYNDSKKNFWVNVDFQYEDEKQEELVYQTIKTLVKDNFSYKENQTQGPIISFKSNESSERNLFFLGVKTSKKEQDIADWIFKCIQVKVSTDNIRIKKKVINKANQANSEELHTNNVSVFFESQAHGERIMIFTSLPTNKALVDEIFEVKHKVTLFLKKTDQDSVSKLTQKMKDYQNNNFTNNNNVTKIDVMNPMAQYPWPPMVPNLNMFMTNKTQLTNQVNIPKNKPVIPQNKEAPVAPKALPPQNIFIKFQQASQEEKKGSIEQIVTAIQTQKAEFDKIDEQSQRGILGQIIYYKISNLDFEKNDKLITYLEDVKNEAQAKAKIEEFKQAVAKITGMLIDLDVFTISDIIDIVKDEKELIERCNEAIDLINQKN